MRRWRQKNPERAKANTRKAWKKFAPKAAELRARIRAMTRANLALFDGLSIIERFGTPLYFMDKNGKLWRDDTRSAEQLIREEQEKCP